jgi:hypothetical protein|tara:strand:+ start:208 stop:399 length:192 start_codon:yes stop_codon:yes gene_type:complete
MIKRKTHHRYTAITATAIPPSLHNYMTYLGYPSLELSNSGGLVVQQGVLYLHVDVNVQNRRRG